MANLQNILGYGGGGFMKGLTEGLQLMERRGVLEQQAEHLKEQTKVLKAQQLLHDEQIKAKGKLAQIIMGAMPQTVGMPEQAQQQSMGVDVGQAPPSVQIPGAQPDPRQLISLAIQSGMPLTPEMFGAGKPTEHVVGPGQTLVRGGQPSYTAPTPPLQIPGGYPPIGGQPPATGGGGPEGAPQAPTTIPGVWAPTLHPETGKSELRFHPFSPAEMKNQADVKTNTELSTAIKRQVDSGKPDFQGIVNASQGIDTPYAQRMMTWAQGELDKLRKAPTTGLTPEAVMREMPEYAGKNYGDSSLTAEDYKKIHGEANRRALEQAKAAGASRAEAWAGVKTVSMLDTMQGNRPVTIPVEELKRAAREEPNRYITAGPSVAALNKTVLLEDIRGTINQTREALANLKEDFTATQAAQISVVLGGTPSPGAIESMFSSAVGRTLTAEQQDYIVRMAQLKENAMAMRSVLGAGQGSDELRAAITATIPSARTPSRQYARKQLDAFEATLNRLGRGIPTVPLKPLPGGTVPGTGEGGANRPMKPFKQMSNEELQQFLK